MMLFFIRGSARALGVVILLLTLGALASSAQTVSPPPPAEYKVVIRYHIRSAIQIRVARFREMASYLQSLGFKKDPGPDDEAADPDQTRMTGTIASDRARRLLRDRHIQAILLIPAAYDLPAEGDKPVKVQLELSGGLPLERQRLLSDQVLGLLRDQGFQAAVGYDNRGHTRIVGSIPAGALEALLEDLRWQGSGWLAPRVPVADLPLPLRNAWPVEVVEVVPEPAGVPPVRSLPPVASPGDGQEYLLKIAPALRALVKQQDTVRMEVILVSEPAANDLSWRRDLSQASPRSLLEGQLGPVVTVKGLPAQAADFARLSGVSGVRLPRPGVPQAAPAAPGTSTSEALRLSGLDRLHAAGNRGRGVRVAIIDSDFRGYQQFVGKQLPASTSHVDLSAECDPELQPRVVPSDTPIAGNGTQCALAAAMAAPDAELILIQVDADAPFQLLEAARYINGEPVYSPSLEARGREQAEESIRLERLRDRLLEERKAIINDFGNDEATQKNREAFFAREKELDSQEKALHLRDQRYLNLTRALRALKGIQVVACGLLWNEGYPVDGSSPLSRYFDGTNFKFSTWFQSIGNTQGQVWSGLFRDVDGNGVMEFAAPGAPLKAGRWTAELSFLGWQPLSGSAAQDLPRTRLRISVQWREPHDPSFWQQGQDLHLGPLANLGLLVLRQRDPSGTRLPSDDLEVIGRSVDLPQRIDNEPSSASYEQMVEFAVDAPGRFALRIEGRVPPSIRPANQPALPGLQTSWELRPRVFVDVLDAPSRASGRAIFWDYASATGNPGMPADAHGVVTIGAADFSGKPRPYSAAGPVFGQELELRPDSISFDALSLPLAASRPNPGSDLANAFAAGLTADVTSTKARRAAFVRELKGRPGRVLYAPKPD